MRAEGVGIRTELPMVPSISLCTQRAPTENSPPVIGLKLVGTWGPRSKGPCQGASLGLRV